MVGQLHQLLLKLMASGAKKNLSAAQARKLLPGVRPGDVAGETRKRVALDLVTDFVNELISGSTLPSSVR
jgi:transposase